jgi:O-antigen ligase
LGVLLVLLLTTSLGALAQRSAVVFRTIELLERGGFAKRDVLWAEAASTWLSHPLKWAVGLGANQFQAATGRDYGWYPHNVVLEAALTGGVVFVFLLAALIGIGVICFARTRRAADPWTTLFFALLVYYVLVSLKSGSLWSAWTVWLYVLAAPLTLPVSRPRQQAVHAQNPNRRSPSHRG